MPSRRAFLASLFAAPVGVKAAKAQPPAGFTWLGQSEPRAVHVDLKLDPKALAVELAKHIPAAIARQRLV